MKKLLLLTMLSALSFVMKADDFTYKHGDDNVTFKLVTNKINVRLKTAMNQESLLSALHNSQIVANPHDQGRVNGIWILQLDKDYPLPALDKLISDLDKNDAVDFASPLLDYNGDLVAMTTQIIMKLSPDDDQDELDDICAADGLTDLGTRENLPDDVHIIQLPISNVIRQFDYVNDLADISTYAQPNLIRYMHQSAYNDPYYASQYALAKINAPAAWVTTPGGSGTIKVAILDVGIDINHPDLIGKTVQGYDATYYPPSSTPPSTAAQSLLNTAGGFANNDYHGTACAGVIAANANNSAGIVGLAYSCKIMPIRMAYNIYDTVFTTDDLIAFDAFSYARTQGADVISCSWGGGPPSQLIENEIHNAVTNGRLGKGCLVFFAAGNDASTTLPFPAYLPDVIAVGASDANDSKASFSNYSTYLDVSAPGDGIITTDLTGSAGHNTASGTTGNYDNFSGTSFSCPYAAGLMALILSVNPALTETQARMVLESTCDPVGGYSYHTDPFSPNGNWCDELGYGRINAGTAITKAASLLPVNTGVLTPVITPEASPICYDSHNNPYFDIKVTGGTTFTSLSTPTFQFYQLFFFTSNMFDVSYPYITGQNSMIVSSNDPAIPASNTKRIYLNSTTLAGATFPLSATIYIDVEDQSTSGGATHHHLSTPVTFTILRGPDMTLPADIYACQGTPLPLNSHFGISYASPPLVFSCDFGSFTGTQSNLTITSPVGEGAVAITLSDQSGCSVTETSLVHFTHLDIGGQGTLKMCVGSPAIPMGATVSGGHGALTYTWSPSTGLSAANVLNPTFTGTTTPGLYNYQLTVNDAQGCSGTGTFVVDVRAPQGGILVASDINNACPGHTVVLSGAIAGLYSSYSPVYFTDGFTNYPTTVSGTTATATVNPMTTTMYSMVAIDPYGCQLSNTVTVTVNTSYGLSVNAGADTIMCANTAPGTLHSTISGGVAPYTYQWMPGNTATQNLQVPNTTQTYTLTVTDNGGCRAIDQATVHATPNYSVISSIYNSGCYGSSVQLVNPAINSNVGPNWTYSGGTPPYTHEWTPHDEFVNPFTPYPTTVPLTHTIIPTLTVTDANGCVSVNKTWVVMVFNDTPSNFYVDSDPCSGSQLCVNSDVGKTLVAQQTTPGGTMFVDPENPTGDSIRYDGYDIAGWITKTYSFSPAPTSQTGSCATFSPGTTSVTITKSEQINYPMWGQPACPPTTTTYNYTFPLKDDARHLLITLPNSDIIYVGTDQLLHRLRWNASTGWQYSTFMPINGWGGIRVEGWLAQNENSTRIFFKSTTGQLNSIANYAGTDDWMLEGYSIGVNVKSDIVYRETANELYYIGTDNKVHRVYWYNHNWHYDAITPVGGWQSIAADSYLTLENAPGTHVYFKTMDNRIFNFWGGTLSSPNLTDMLVSGCGGDIINNPATGGLYFKTLTNKIHKLDWNGSAWAESLINPINNSGYTVDGYLTVNPTNNQVFYKAPDRTIHFINPYAGSYYDNTTDVNQNQTAGDLVYFDSKLIYIHRDKTIHQYMLNGTGFVDAQVNHTPANVKACSYEFRALMIAGDPDDDGSSDQPTSVTDNAMDPTLVNVYPNPSEGQFTIEINSGTTAVIDVYDVLGNKVKSIQKEKDKAIYQLDLSAYGKGIYMIGITSDGKHTSKKIMIK